MEFVSEEEEQVAEISEHLDGEIEALVQRMGMLGREPAPWFRIDMMLQTVIEMLFEDDPAAFGILQLRNKMKVRDVLVAMVEKAGQPQLLTPGDD